VNAQTSKAIDWLISQNTTPAEISWFLEIESLNAASCEISYSGSNYVVNVDEDKTLSNNAGSCLSLAQDDYWLRISPSCMDREFRVSCDQDFLTTLLFQETGEPTVHVTEKTSSASADGITTEKVESSCFTGSTNSVCNYEASLWATLALDAVGEEVSAYLPYLIVKADDNERFLPEAFLYILTGNEEYRSNLLLKQKSNQWWMESGDEYFDTALALYPFQNENPQEKQDSKDWLLESQDGEGCWEGNVRNTAFILASIWPRNTGGSGGGTGDSGSCESAGFYCMSGASCGGEILDEYSCTSLFRCCSQPQEFETCSELNGEVCASNQFCSGGNEVQTGELIGGESCCVEGFCQAVVDEPENECESQEGICRFTCEDGEQESSYDCRTSGAVCCIFEPASSEGGSYWWIWVLMILILLLVVGIIFRDKLREWWLKAKSKFGKRRGSGSPSTIPRGPPSHGFPGVPSSRHPIRIPERKILLPTQQPKPRHAPKLRRSGTQKELDDVLKKLKEMSK
jgi:hypothetical protein